MSKVSVEKKFTIELDEDQALLIASLLARVAIGDEISDSLEPVADELFKHFPYGTRLDLVDFDKRPIEYVQFRPRNSDEG